MADFRDVPPTRSTGADPAKLARRIALYGRSSIGMPPPWVYEGTDGVLILYNGVTRATRIAKLSPGTLIRVEKSLENCQNRLQVSLELETCCHE